jgi:hypothetical protein
MLAASSSLPNLQPILRHIPRGGSEKSERNLNSQKKKIMGVINLAELG